MNSSLTMPDSFDILYEYRPKWRNWQTRTTQNRVPSGNVGSIPTFGIGMISPALLASAPQPGRATFYLLPDLSRKPTGSGGYACQT